jgi:predicted Zn-dependent protease
MTTTRSTPAAFVLSCVMTVVLAAPASAQLPGILGKAKRAEDAAKKVADLNISEQDERKIGEDVSRRLRDTFGVYQDADVTKYVALVGSVLAQASSRPNLNWTFIVLDTDGVNAFAAPGGIVHVTRGLLGLMQNEAQLAGVLGHEITHVTAKHTVHAIQKSKVVSLGAEQSRTGTLTSEIVSRLAEQAYHMVLENQFDRGDEMEADKIGVRLANEVGYAPSGLVEALRQLSNRNKGSEAPNGLFASHPDTKARIDALTKLIAQEKLNATATVAARYKEHITFEAKPVTDIATVAPGSRGLAGGGSAAAEKTDGKDEKPAEPKKKGGLLRKFGLSSGQQAQSGQQVASAGGRAIGPDTLATGGPNKSPVPVTITPAELDTFRKGIAG